VEAEVEQCPLFCRIYREENRSVQGIGIADANVSNPAVFQAITRRERFLNMSDAQHNARLYRALVNKFK
jgi:hypothetical protein